jgi:bifunctional DNase/RNase
VIGSPEAQSIAIFLEGPDMERPLTHDLFCNFLLERSIDVEHVSIDGSMENIFFATMTFTDGRSMDCRPSDAISIAIRLGSTIFIQNDIVEQLSFEHQSPEEREPEEKYESKKKKKPSSRKKKPDESLMNNREEMEKMLQDAIEREDYEEAAKLRDMINRP